MLSSDVAMAALDPGRPRPASSGSLHVAVVMFLWLPGVPAAVQDGRGQMQTRLAFCPRHGLAVP